MDMHLDPAILSGRRTARQDLRRVVDLRSLDHLIKESELLSGKPGLSLRISRNCPRHYQVTLAAGGYDVQILGPKGGPLLASDFLDADTMARALQLHQPYAEPWAR